MKKNVNKAGFTIVELLIAIAATAILVLTATLLLFMPYRSLRTNIEYATLRREMSFAVRMMSNDIRESSFSGVAAAENSLSLPANSIRADAVEFRRTDGVLTPYLNNVAQAPIITGGLLQFSPVIVDDLATGLRGVMLHLEMANADGEITLVNETFIHTRN